MGASQNPTPQHVLNSWKEIAQYVGRGVRTVQRWEQFLDFPVRRPHGRSRSAVIALPEEIDDWLKRAPLGNGEGVGPNPARRLPRNRIAPETDERRRVFSQLAHSTHELALRLNAQTASALAQLARAAKLCERLRKFAPQND